MSEQREKSRAEIEEERRILFVPWWTQRVDLAATCEWPVTPEHIADLEQWLKDYEKRTAQRAVPFTIEISFGDDWSAR